MARNFTLLAYMTNQGPIIILEDDSDDVQILKEAFSQLGAKNRLEVFDEGETALEFIRTTVEKPFLIISNIRLKKMNGLEVREKIQADPVLRRKSIPFIFLSTDTRKQVVDQAYRLMVQGFFEKRDTMPAIQKQLEEILLYWDACIHPNIL